MPRDRTIRVSQRVVPSPISTQSRPTATQRARLGPRRPGAAPVINPGRPIPNHVPPIHNPVPQVLPQLPAIPETGNPFQFPVNLRPFLMGYHKGPFIIGELDKEVHEIHPTSVQEAVKACVSLLLKRTKTLKFGKY